nr:hypothetical protein [Tanacetum cinerariifolium]
MEFVKKSIDERAQHKRENDNWVNERQMQTIEENVDMSKPLDAITTHYLPKEREAASAKPHHMIASSNSKISSKNMPRFSLNDMVHNYYLEVAKKETQERSRNLEPSLMAPARSQSTANGSKPNPKINNQNSRNWPASKNSFVTTKTVPIVEYSRNLRNFLTPNILFARHVRNVSSMQIMILMWKPTGKILKTVGLRWVPTGKIFNSSTIKVDSEPPNGLNADITNQYECDQTLDVSACTLNLSAGHKNDFVSDLLIDFQIKFSLSIGEILTHWFTLIVLSALRRSGNENMLGLVILILRSNLTDLQVTPTNLDE